jgi:hypothetical protein
VLRFLSDAIVVSGVTVTTGFDISSPTVTSSISRIAAILLTRSSASGPVLRSSTES